MEPKTLVESNRRTKLMMAERYNKAIVESMRESFDIDLTDKEKFDFGSPFFNWKGFRESAYRVAKRQLQESNSEGVFSALLRAGINNIANSWYQLVPTNHEEIAGMTTSTHAVEPYPVVHRGGVPRMVARGTPFPEVKVAGPIDNQIQNLKFGAITGLEKELFDDDQSGVINMRVQDIGPNMAILEDAWTFQRFIGTSGTYAGDAIPASETFTTVWSTSLSGGGANKPSSYGAFTPALVQAADLALMNQLDLLGNKMLVTTNTLLVGTSNKFSAMTLLNSNWYPTTASIKVGGGSGADSTVGTTYADNVLKGLYNLVISRFMPLKSWAIGEAGKGLIFQMREGLSVVQENPQSGLPFSQDEYRFRAKARWNVDWVDPRFWYLGNDGTV